MELTIREVLRRAGGGRKISDYINRHGNGLSITPSGVDRWQYGSIPPVYWPFLIELTKGLAPLTNDDLAALHQKPKNPAGTPDRASGNLP